MKESMDRLYETLERALDKVSNEQLTSSNLDNIFKIIGTMYKLDKMEEMGGQGSEYSLDGGSYARGRGRNAKRDSMGRYARDGGSNDSYSRDGYSRDYSRDGYSREYSREGYSRGNSYGGYSRHNKEDIRMELEELMQDVQDPKVKQMMEQWVQQLDK